MPLPFDPHYGNFNRRKQTYRPREQRCVRSADTRALNPRPHLRLEHKTTRIESASRRLCTQQCTRVIVITQHTHGINAFTQDRL